MSVHQPAQFAKYFLLIVVIVNINSIKDVLVYSNSRLKITLTQEFDKEIIVSREKVGEFKDWFDGSRAGF